MPKFYTKSGNFIKNNASYAKTGAPMFDNKGNDINKPHTVYKANLSYGKKYIGKTTNLDRRINQHIQGNGSQVTKKFKPKSFEIVDKVPGYFSSHVEQYHTEKNIKKYGYDNVRGGSYTNSKTLKKIIIKKTRKNSNS